MNIKDLNKRGRKISRITKESDRLLYHMEDGCIAVSPFCHDLSELEEMNARELIRAGHGPGVGVDDVNCPKDCVFIVNTVSAKDPTPEHNYYTIEHSMSISAFKTLKEAFASIDLLDCFWTKDKFSIERLDDDHLEWDGLSNDDVETYLVKCDDALNYVIHCQFIGDIKELRERVHNYEINNKDYILFEEIGKRVQEAKAFCRTNKIEFVNNSVEDHNA